MFDKLKTMPFSSKDNETHRFVRPVSIFMKIKTDKPQKNL